MRIVHLTYAIVYTFLFLGTRAIYAQCPDRIESNSTTIIENETCIGSEDGSISIDFVTAAGIYEPSIGDLDPTGGYRYALWDASIPGYVYDDIGFAPPTSPINPNINIEFNPPNNIVFRNLPPNTGIFGYFIVAERQDGDGCANIYVGDPLGMHIDPGQPLPTANLSGGGIVCAGDPLPDVVFNFTGATPYDFTYTVSGTPVTVTGHNSDVYTINNAAVGTYEITVLSDGNVCSGTDLGTPVSVAENPLPSPTISGPANVCFGDVGIYTTESGSGESNYVWEVIGGVIIGGGTTADPTVQVRWDGLGPFNVSVNYDNTFGCDAASPISYPVNVNPLPVPTISGPADVCSGSTNIYSTESGSGENSYIWSVSGGTIISGGNPTDASIEISWNGSAPYQLSISYTDGNGCTALIPTVETINVNPLPVPGLSGNVAVCAGTQETYITDSGTGESNYIWTVNGGTIISGGTASDPNIEILWDGAAPYNVEVNYTDINGCTASSPTILPITVVPLPIPSLDGPGTVCELSTQIYSTDSTAGQSNFVWNVSGGTIVGGGSLTDPSVQITWDGSTPYQVSVSYTDVNGCIASPPTLLPVTIDPLPEPTITGNNEVCFESNETYITESGSGISDYTWVVSGGTIVSGGNASDPNIEIQWDGTAPYEVGVNYLGANGCSAINSTILPVNVNPTPSSITFSGDATICENESAILSLVVTGGSQPYNVFISTDGGATIADTILILDSNPFAYNTGPVPLTTTYSVVGVSDLNDCTLDPALLPADVTVTVNPREDVVMSIPNSSGNMGEQLVMPVTVQGFNNIITANMTITWDETIIRFIGIENIAGINELDPTDFNLNDSSTLTLFWTESGSVGQSVPDGQSLFEIRYELIGPDCFASSIAFANSPISISVIDANLCGADLTLNDGSVNVGGSGMSATPVMVFSDTLNCLNDPVPQLISSGVNIQWYSDMALTNLIGTGNTYTPVLNNTTSVDTIFYATQTIGLCSESLPDSTRIQYIDLPANPPSPGQRRYEICVNDSAPTLAAIGTDILWFSDPGLTNLVGIGNTYTPGPGELDTTVPDTTYFYMVQSNICGIGPYDSTSVHVKIQSYPPIVNTLTTVCVGDPAPNLAAIGINIQWYSDVGLTNLVGTGNSFMPDSTLLDMSVSGNTSFYATQDDGCGVSIGAEVVVSAIWCVVDCSAISANVTTVDPGCNSSDGEIQIIATGGTGFYTYQLINPDSILVSNKTGFFNNLSDGIYLYNIVDDTAMCITERDTVILTNPSNILASADTASFVNSFCYDQPWGRAIINVTGGSDPYEYSLNGFEWNTFNSGQYIDSLPPLGTFLILVRENNRSICIEQVPVTINNEYSEIEFTYSTIDATCSNDDGELEIETLSGGLEPYEISIDFGDFTPVDMNDLPVYTGLSEGMKNIRIKDINNCVIEDAGVLVDFPGNLQAIIQTISPSCAGGGLDGQVRIYIDSAANIHKPPYLFGFANDDTPESEVTMQSLPSNTWVTIDTLTNGYYYVLLSSATACESRNDVTIIGGPTSISFDLSEINVVPCKGENGTGSVTVENVIGDSIQIYLLELIAIPSASVLYNASLTQDDFIGGYTIDGSVTDQIMAGQYQINLSQNQNGCNLSSTSEIFEIFEPENELAFSITGVEDSWVDIASGTVSIELSPSGGDPYETRIETVMSHFPGQDIDREWDEIMWDGSNYTYSHEKLYSGVYEVSVRDAYGCELFQEVTVGHDTAIFVPNVFTPNNDSHNDYFYIRNLPAPGSGTVLIVSNRWGKIIFETDDYNYDNLWDGGDNPDGTYFYKIDIPGRGGYTGWVEIWRGDSR